LAELIAASGETLRPRLTITTIAAFAIAGLIHLLSVVVLTTGLLMVFTGYLDPGYIIWGVFCVVLGWLMLPRPILLPKNSEQGALLRVGKTRIAAKADQQHDDGSEQALASGFEPKRAFAWCARCHRARRQRFAPLLLPVRER
jgi:hypothetical protein